MTLQLLRSLALVTALTGGAAVGAEKLPPTTDEAVALPGAAWLALTGRELQLVDAGGTVRARVALRGESLDARVAGRQGKALLIDSNAERPVALSLDLEAWTLTRLPPLPDLGQSVSTTCLYRDPQGAVHAFAIGENGIARQWIFDDERALPVREVAVAPEAGHCRVDDRLQLLYVSEPGGVWAHRAEPEGAPSRHVVALTQPLGPLAEGGGPVVITPSGLAVSDAGRSVIRLFRAPARNGGVWRSAGTLRLAGRKAERLAVDETGRLNVRGDGEPRWHAQALPAMKRVAAERSLPIVTARAQTDPVAQHGDAADDPAIWVHPGDPAASLILGTDKKRGLGVYGLDGQERQFLAIGRLNNVDLRQDVRVGTQRLDLAVATHRDDNAVVLLRIDAAGRVSEIGRIATDFEDIYGICMYRPADATAHVYVNDKSGRTLHLRVDTGADGRPTGTRLREFKLGSQPEGCVGDDRHGRIFVGEEKRGIWALSADPAVPAVLELVLSVGDTLKADVEGMGVIHAKGGSWLVVSSQGNDSFVVLDAKPPYRPRGVFRIGANLAAAVDGVSETDGLEVTGASLGPDYPLGLLVVQDGYKVMPSGPQNFKLVDWRDVARSLGLD